MMKIGDCYQLGYVIKTRGLKGELQIFLDVDTPSAYQNLESVLIFRNGELVPFFFEHIQVFNQKAIVKFEEVDTIEQANILVSSELYLPTNTLPDLPKGEYYYHQLVGLDLYDNNVLLGKVEQIYKMPSQNIISLFCKGVEIMIPVNDEIIKKVKIDEGKIEAVLPEGLLDVYLEEG